MAEPTAVPEAGAIVPQSWSSHMLELFTSRQPPPALGTVEGDKIEAKAREVLKDYPSAFMYVNGSAGTSQTYRDNLKAFETWKIVPRMLVDATTRNLETTIFGVKLSSPVLIAPIGVQGLMHADAELATARASKNVGVPLIMSTASSRSIEEVAQENGSNSHRWYQLYWPRSPELTLSILSRAKNNGFTTLVVTLDTVILGWRPHDLAKAYIPFFHGFGTQVGMSDPVFMKRFGFKPLLDYHPTFPYDHVAKDKANQAGDELSKRDTMLGTEFLKEVNSGVFRSWEDLKFLRDNWKGPLVLKGIQRVQDAEKALEYGIDGIVVSNHGGRQVDGGLASLYALNNICKSPTIQAAQKAGTLTVLFDSGIRNGSDIIKALAIGAQAVLVARPIMYGLAVKGQAGVEEVLKNLLADLEITMGLSGYKNISEFQGKGEEIVTQV